MEQFKNKVLFFADLDDSMFQTKRKDVTGKFKATFPKNILKTSYYTKAQQQLLHFVLSNQEIVFIPLTARTEAQYKRTAIYKQGQANIYAIYYGSSLYIDDKEHKPYFKTIQKQFEADFQDLHKIISITHKKFPNAVFVNVDGKYFTTDQKESTFVQFINKLVATNYPNIDIYTEEKYITLLPRVCNKMSVVSYLKKKLKPKLTIGIGNSESDIDFLNLCDFKIISHIGGLQEKLSKK
jgi:hypothetical protein